MKIEEQVFTDPKLAGAKIQILFDVLGADKEMAVGEYRGFNISLSKIETPFDGMLKYILLTNPKETKSHKVEPSALPKATINKIDRTLDDFEKELESISVQLDRSKNAIVYIQDALDKPFEQEEKLQELIIRQKELDALLNQDQDAEVSEEETA